VGRGFKIIHIKKGDKKKHPDDVRKIYQNKDNNRVHS